VTSPTENRYGRSRPTFDEVYMRVVDIISERSTCLRKQVGAVLIVDNRIVSHGYNGVPSGQPHCIDTGRCLKDEAGDEEYKVCLHAEQNAISQCAKRGLATMGGTLYVNADICITCAKMVLASGIQRVVIRRDNMGGDHGINLLRLHGLRVDEIPAPPSLEQP